MFELPWLACEMRATAVVPWNSFKPTPDARNFGFGVLWLPRHTFKVSLATHVQNPLGAVEKRLSAKSLNFPLANSPELAYFGGLLNWSM
jgi:hypothetical protein